MDICSTANISLMIELIFTQRNSCMPNFFRTWHANEDKAGSTSLPSWIRSVLWEAERELSGKVLQRNSWKHLSKQEKVIGKRLILYYTSYGWIEMVWLVQCIRELTYYARQT